MNEMNEIEASAHGRVNLIGEHTDYNDGFVLPTSIPQATTVRIRARKDHLVYVQSDVSLKTEVASFALGDEVKTGSWIDYIAGATWKLRSEGFVLNSGLEISITSNVPMGSGLSSSAALLVATLRALRDFFNFGGLDDIRVSQLAQAIENEFVGARVGIMDPMAASLAEEGTALFLDTQSLQFQRVPIPVRLVELAVINSGIAHRHSGGSYNERRAECEKACQLLGVSSLREMTMQDLERISKLPEPLNRRAKHVVTENARVLSAVTALKNGDIPTLGQLFNDSHTSMSADYEVSLPEIDTLVAICNRQPDVMGARLTGGGFGGSVVVITKPGQARSAAESICAAYRTSVGETPEILVPS